MFSGWTLMVASRIGVTSFHRRWAAGKPQVTEDQQLGHRQRRLGRSVAQRGQLAVFLDRLVDPARMVASEPASPDRAGISSRPPGRVISTALRKALYWRSVSPTCS